MNVVRLITMLALVLLAIFQQLELRGAWAAMAELNAATDKLLAADQRLKTADDELKKRAQDLARACGIQGLP